jgi:nucleotide-binding universal stress UspA family protein
MTNTILLPLDGSALADRARPYAAALARRTRGRVVLMEAVALRTRPDQPTSNADIKVMDQADRFLAAAAAELTAEGIHAEYHELYEEPAQAIIDATKRYDADLVVMATHGRSGIGRMIYGSVADQVLRHSTVPVLLVPAHSDRSWSSDKPLSVLVPLDGSALAEEALASAQRLSEAFAAHVQLLRVVEPPTYPLYGEGYAYIPFDEEADLADARTYIEERADSLRKHGFQVSTAVLVGNPGRTIEVYAREQNVDVIAMATHGLGGLGRLVLGSVATDVLRRGVVPVLLLRPTAVTTQVAPPTVAAVQPTATATAAPATAAVPASTSTRSRTVEIEATALPLIVRGLRAIAYQPGTEYADVVAARALADQLEEQAAPQGSLSGSSR